MKASLLVLAVAAALSGCFATGPGYYLAVDGSGQQMGGWQPQYPPPPTPPGATASAAPAPNQAAAGQQQKTQGSRPVTEEHMAVCFAGRNFKYCYRGSTWGP